jgi:hypothetical protein
MNIQQINKIYYQLTLEETLCLKIIETKVKLEKRMS